MSKKLIQLFGRLVAVAALGLGQGLRRIFRLGGDARACPARTGHQRGRLRLLVLGAAATPQLDWAVARSLVRTGHSVRRARGTPPGHLLAAMPLPCGRARWLTESDLLRRGTAAGARAATEAQWLMHRARARVRSTRLDPSFPTMYGSGGRIATHFLRISSSATQVPNCVIKTAAAELRQIHPTMHKDLL